MLTKRKKHCNKFGDGGGFDFSQIASMFQNKDGNTNWTNFMNSEGMQSAYQGVQSLNDSTDDYKYHSGTKITSAYQQNQKGKLSSIGQGVDMTLQIMDMIDKANHSKDKRSLEQISGIYANGGNLFGDGGVSVDSIGNAIGTASMLAENYKEQAAIRDTSSLRSSIRHNTVEGYQQGMTFDDIANQYSNLREMNHVTADNLRPNSWFSDIVNSVSAGNQGAQSGFNMGGGAGAILGGVAGSISSLIGSINGRKKARQEAKEVNELVDNINKYNDRQLINNSQNVKQEQIGNMFSQYYALGGPLDSNFDFDLGVMAINAGGTHEENPNDGVQVGVDPEGKPNLVEEGEVIWKDKDYVFSNRLKASKKLLEDNLLPTNLADKSFADIAKELTSYSEERPIDSISKDTRDAMFTRLMTAQESIREKKENNKVKQEYNAMSPEEQNAMMMQEASQEQMQEEQMQEAPPEMPMFAEGGFMNKNIFKGGGKKKKSLTLNDNLTGVGNATKFLEEFNKLPPEEAMAILSGNKVTSNVIDPSKTNLDDVTISGTDKTKAKLDLSKFQDMQGVSLSRLPNKTLKSKIDSTKIPTTLPLDTTTSLDPESKVNPLRYMSLIPSAYGLSNPPTAGVMNPSRAREVAFDTSGTELHLKPWDFNFVANQLLANSRATDRALLNSAGNRGQALAGLLVNGYNTTVGLGKAYQQGFDYNNTLREKEANFYNSRNLANAQGKMSAMAQNAQQDAAYDQRRLASMQYNQEEQDKVYAAKLANLQNFYDNLAAIGEDTQNREDAYRTAKAQREYIGSSKKCNGGKIRRRRKSLTY